APGPVLGQCRRHGLLKLVLVRGGAFYHVLEQRPVGIAPHAALSRLARAHVQELVDDLGRAVLALLPLIECLHGGEARRLAPAGRGAGGADEFRQRRPSATMARQACAASPPLSPRSMKARALACSMVSTVTMP